MPRFDYSNHRYGASWYRYYDGMPHPDDDQDYEWTGSFWAPMDDWTLEQIVDDERY